MNTLTHGYEPDTLSLPHAKQQCFTAMNDV